jgi:hypothetical protein|nr:MAG TPA: Terminase small subunit [Caudoviricetes sp.]
MANRPVVHTGDKVSTVGRARTFETPNDLRESCLEYLAWAHANPLQEEKHFCSAGQIMTAHISKPRAVTIVGLCLHLGIHRHTWQNYRISEEFDLVCDEIEDRMKQYKFENAVAGLMNPTLIARDIGLVDKQEIDLSSKDGTMSPKEQSAAVLEALKRKHAE